MLKRALLVAFALALSPQASATIIEGFDPSGNFRAVGVDATGRFLVATATGVAQRVIIDSGTVTANQGAPGSTPWPVSTSVGVSLTVQASTASIISGYGSFSVSAASIVYPASATRKQGVLCNTSSAVNLYIGDASVVAGTGAYLPPGACLSPDNPSRYIGDIYGASTGTATGYIFTVD